MCRWFIGYMSSTFSPENVKNILLCNRTTFDQKRRKKLEDSGSGEIGVRNPGDEVESP